eukprot:11507176-Ditylum_brightwellii.AAC.1
MAKYAHTRPSTMITSSDKLEHPEGGDIPNKKYYDPCMMLKAGEETMATCLLDAVEDLNCVDVLN